LGLTGRGRLQVALPETLMNQLLGLASFLQYQISKTSKGIRSKGNQLQALVENMAKEE
jgi:hypothetical protein